MSRTLRFGTARDSDVLAVRTQRYVMRRRTDQGFDLEAERAAADFHAASVARQVSPKPKQYVTFRKDAPQFGKRAQCPHNQTYCLRHNLGPTDCPVCKRGA